MKKVAILLLLLVGFTLLFVPLGCKKEQPSPTPRITAAPPVITPVPTPVRTVAAPTPAPTSPATPAVTPAPAPTPVGAPLNLTVDSPAAESIVRDRTVTVRGKTSPDAVVTVGNKNIDVDENGSFTASVSLTEGVNIIEVLASDLTGSTKGQVLTVIYTP